MPTATALAGKRIPVRSHSTSEIPIMTAIKENVAMQHRPDDVAQSLPTPSPSTELFVGTFDTADPVVLPTEVYGLCLLGDPATGVQCMHVITSVDRHLKYAWGLGIVYITTIAI